MRPDLVRITHMLDAAREIVDFCQDATRESLEEDRKLNLSVVHLLEILGEAAAGISLEFQNEHPEIPWSSIIGMRNRLIHGYSDIDLDIVWRTSLEDIPPLVDILEIVLASENNNGE